MKARGLINWCVMLLWFVATYHCAFEQLISKHGSQPVSQAATSDSSSPTECPAHPSGDPSSHNEGQSCGTVVQPSSSNELSDATQLALIPIANALLAVLSSTFSYEHSSSLSPTALFETANATALSQRAHSLSIAPNAPPVTLA